MPVGYGPGYKNEDQVGGKRHYRKSKAKRSRRRGKSSAKTYKKKIRGGLRRRSTRRR
tara:strand:- start:1114 stop:1284 length:171 start_codon:yes stop_codon:yes gene_type:complete